MRTILFLPFIVPIFPCYVPLVSPIPWRDLQSFLFYCFPLFLCIVHLRRPSHLFLLFSGTPFFFNQLFVKPHCGSGSHSVMSDSLRPHGLYSPWNSLGQNTGVGSLSLLHGIFPTQGSNPGLPYCRQILYQLSHNRSLLRQSFCLCKKHFFFLGTDLVTTSCGVANNVTNLCPQFFIHSVYQI